MCVIEAVTGEPPFAYFDDTTICQHLVEGLVLPRPKGLSDPAWELAVAMTSSDPAKPPPLASVIQGFKSLKQTNDTITSRALTAQNPSKAKGTKRGFSERTDVAELIAGLKSDSETVRYATLKWLYRKMEIVDEARALKKADGYRWLIHAVEQPGATWRASLYAQGCLYRLLMPALITIDEYLALTRLDLTPTGLKELMDTIKDPNHDELSPRAHVQGEELGRQSDHAAVVKHGAIALLLNQLDVGPTRLQEQSALTLGYIARFDNSCATPDVVQFLVELTTTRDGELQIEATASIRDVAFNQANQSVLDEVGMIRPLLDAMVNTSIAQKELLSLTLLATLARESSRRTFVAAGGIPLFHAFAQTCRKDCQRTVPMAFSVLASNSEARSAAIRSAGGIAVLVELLRGDNDSPKLYSTKALRNRACSESNQLAIVTAGAITPVVGLLRSGAEQKGAAAELLGNLACNHEATARSIRATGAIPLILDLLVNGDEKIRRCAIRAMTELARIPENAASIVDAGGVQALVALAKTENIKTKALAVAALHLLGQDDQIAALGFSN